MGEMDILIIISGATPVLLFFWVIKMYLHQRCTDDLLRVAYSTIERMTERNDQHNAQLCKLRNEMRAELAAQTTNQGEK